MVCLLSSIRCSRISSAFSLFDSVRSSLNTNESPHIRNRNIHRCEGGILGVEVLMS